MRATELQFRSPSEVTEGCGIAANVTYDGRDMKQGKLMDAYRQKSQLQKKLKGIKEKNKMMIGNEKAQGGSMGVYLGKSTNLKMRTDLKRNPNESIISLRAFDSSIQSAAKLGQSSLSRSKSRSKSPLQPPGGQDRSGSPNRCTFKKVPLPDKLVSGAVGFEGFSGSQYRFRYRDLELSGKNTLLGPDLYSWGKDKDKLHEQPCQVKFDKPNKDGVQYMMFGNRRLVYPPKPATTANRVSTTRDTSPGCKKHEEYVRRIMKISKLGSEISTQHGKPVTVSQHGRAVFVTSPDSILIEAKPQSALKSAKDEEKTKESISANPSGSKFIDQADFVELIKQNKQRNLSAVISQVDRVSEGVEITATGTEHQTFGDNKHIVIGGIEDFEKELKQTNKEIRAASAAAKRPRPNNQHQRQRNFMKSAKIGQQRTSMYHINAAGDQYLSGNYLQPGPTLQRSQTYFNKRQCRKAAGTQSMANLHGPKGTYRQQRVLSQKNLSNGSASSPGLKPNPSSKISAVGSQLMILDEGGYNYHKIYSPKSCRTGAAQVIIQASNQREYVQELIKKQRASRASTAAGNRTTHNARNTMFSRQSPTNENDAKTTSNYLTSQNKSQGSQSPKPRAKSKKLFVLTHNKDVISNHISNLKNLSKQRNRLQNQTQTQPSEKALEKALDNRFNQSDKYTHQNNGLKTQGSEKLPKMLTNLDGKYFDQHVNIIAAENYNQDILNVKTSLDGPQINIKESSIRDQKAQPNVKSQFQTSNEIDFYERDTGPGSQLESITAQDVMDYLHPKPKEVVKPQQKRKPGTLQISNRERKLIAAKKKEIDKSLDLLHAYGEYTRFLKVTKNFIQTKCVRQKSKTRQRAGRVLCSKQAKGQKQISNQLKDNQNWDSSDNRQYMKLMEKADVADIQNLEKQMKKYDHLNNNLRRSPNYDKDYHGWSKEYEDDDDEDDQIIYRHDSGEIQQLSAILSDSDQEGSGAELSIQDCKEAYLMQKNVAEDESPSVVNEDDTAKSPVQLDSAQQNQSPIKSQEELRPDHQNLSEKASLRIPDNETTNKVEKSAVRKRRSNQSHQMPENKDGEDDGDFLEIIQKVVKQNDSDIVRRAEAGMSFKNTEENSPNSQVIFDSINDRRNSSSCALNKFEDKDQNFSNAQKQLKVQTQIATNQTTQPTQIVQKFSQNIYEVQSSDLRKSENQNETPGFLIQERILQPVNLEKVQSQITQKTSNISQFDHIIEQSQSNILIRDLSKSTIMTIKVDEDGAPLESAKSKNTKYSKQSKNQRSSQHNELKEDTSDNNVPASQQNQNADLVDVQVPEVSDFVLSDSSAFKIDSLNKLQQKNDKFTSENLLNNYPQPVPMAQKENIDDINYIGANLNKKDSRISNQTPDPKTKSEEMININMSNIEVCKSNTQVLPITDESPENSPYASNPGTINSIPQGQIGQGGPVTEKPSKDDENDDNNRQLDDEQKEQIDIENMDLDNELIQLQEQSQENSAENGSDIQKHLKQMEDIKKTNKQQYLQRRSNNEDQTVIEEISARKEQSDVSASMVDKSKSYHNFPSMQQSQLSIEQMAQIQEGNSNGGGAERSKSLKVTKNLQRKSNKKPSLVMKGDATTKTPEIQKLIKGEPRLSNQQKSNTVVKTDGDKADSSASDESLSLRGKQAKSVKVDISELNIGENSSPLVTDQMGSPLASQKMGFREAVAAHQDAQNAKSSTSITKEEIFPDLNEKIEKLGDLENLQAMTSPAEAEEEDEYYDEEEDEEAPPDDGQQVLPGQDNGTNGQLQNLNLHDLSQFSSPNLSQNAQQTTAYFNQQSNNLIDKQAVYISSLTGGPSDPQGTLQSESTLQRYIESGETLLRTSPSPSALKSKSKLENQQEQIYEYYDEEDEASEEMSADQTPTNAMTQKVHHQEKQVNEMDSAEDQGEKSSSINKSSSNKNTQQEYEYYDEEEGEDDKTGDIQMR